MGKEAIIGFLKPDWRRLLLLIIFMFIVFAGIVQSWVFYGKDARLPKPPLFDLLSFIPFWSIWVLLLLPLGLLSEDAVAIEGLRGRFHYEGSLSPIFGDKFGLFLPSFLLGHLHLG